ncbi:class I SAM-dependent methyltransferase [Salsipaludibacter albus]|uniref:class I SAM-dependent methyltransferase n=1 Tax=Salsipaludibacter albus TaxID=2849650 RepID=UPI001EE4D76A|nr:class I SAM-dependent methyltransferase [Salsipaludibacter albus]MBY5163541.1 class I SAM-dependent methyltransferase [Salsipaludibacter albus]
MVLTRVAGSFRDPAGFVFSRDGRLLRQVNRVHAETWDAVAASDLFPALWDAGLLVHHEEVDVALGDQRAHVVIEPERITTLSQPHEWAPGQLRAAALATLEVQRTALDHGMTLRDASAHNIQFHHGRPVFIDTLSFEPLVEGRPWIAHGQFCEQFLAPLALQTLVDPRLRRLLVARLDGVELDLASQLLPGRTKLRPGLAQHLHLHARARGRGGSGGGGGSSREATFSHNALVGLVDSLRRTVSKLEYRPSGTVWGDYYAEADHYVRDAMEAKVALVREHVATVAPEIVWDLGANTGRFADLAVEAGATTVAWDIDVGAVEKAWQELAAGSPRDLLPLVLDLTNPSPGLGWAHAERPSLADRGPVDLVLALALVHHLSIGANVPLPDVVAELARLGRHVVVEWVPKGDPKVDVLLSTREDVFADYTREVFVEAVDRHFETVSVSPLPQSDRELFLLRRRDD